MVEEGIASISIRREKWRGSLLLRFSSSLFIYLFNGEYGGGDRKFLFYTSGIFFLEDYIYFRII